MRIFTSAVFNLRTGFGIFTRCENYEGPVAYAGGGSDVTNETVPTGPFGPQIPFILSLFDQASNLFNQGVPQAFPGVDPQGNVAEGGSLVPDLNQNLAGTQQGIGDLAGSNIGQNFDIQQFLQQLGGGTNVGAQFGQALVPGIAGGIGAQLNAGDNALSGAAGGQLGAQADAFSTIFQQQPGQIGTPITQGGATDASAAIEQLLAGGGGQNSFLDALVQSQIQSQVDSFGRNVLPGIRTEAQQAGQIGGTRQGIAEGNAANDLLTSIGNTTGSIYANAFNTQVGAQSQALQNILGAQAGDQSAFLQAGGINNQNFQQYIQSLLQGTGQVGSQLGQGIGLGLNAIGTGTAQAGNIFQGGQAIDLQQTLGALGLIPGFQAGSLGQFGAVNQLGLQQYGLDQASIDALSQQYYFNQNSPFNLLSQYQQFITGPYGSTVFGDNLDQNQQFQNTQLPLQDPVPQALPQSPGEGKGDTGTNVVAPPPPGPFQPPPPTPLIQPNAPPISDPQQPPNLLTGGI